MLMVILKSSIPVVTVGLPRFSALCEWKCYLQMETERTCVYFCVVLHPLVPPKRHSPTSNPVVGKSYLNSCVFSSHALSAIIDIVLCFFLAITLFVTWSWKTWCRMYHICNEKCHSTTFLIKTAAELILEIIMSWASKPTQRQPTTEKTRFCWYRFYTYEMYNSGEQLLFVLIQTR